MEKYNKPPKPIYTLTFKLPGCYNWPLQKKKDRTIEATQSKHIVLNCHLYYTEADKDVFKNPTGFGAGFGDLL